MSMETIEKQDIQGLVLKAYGRMCNTRYSLLRVNDAALARVWLSRLILELADGDHPAVHTCLNVAFTAEGLVAIGLSKQNLRQFSREFREGMTETHRRRILGDHGDSSPEHWRWGGTSGTASASEIHILLLVFARNEAVLRDYWAQLETTIAQHKLSIVTNLETVRSKENKEPFGFRDGLSQPQICGLHPQTNPDETVAPGEFLLGYKNEYGVLPESPIIPAVPQQGDVSVLPSIAPGLKDLGRNGSYLVFRQIEQHVEKFWNFAKRNSSSEHAARRLASKMVGRWPSGAPLTLYPDSDPGDQHATNDFGYASQDQEGVRCPIGSHIRRSNPRDVFEQNGAAHSIRLTKKHRILRRGRPYCQPSEHDPNVQETGIHFLCFNADFSHQFEFIQHSWCNYPQFDHLYNDPDPLIGASANPTPGLTQDFTVQGCPVNQHVHGLERFVTIRGGAYFFFPSFNAIRYFASL